MPAIAQCTPSVRTEGSPWPVARRQTNRRADPPTLIALPDHPPGMRALPMNGVARGCAYRLPFANSIVHVALSGDTFGAAGSSRRRLSAGRRERTARQCQSRACKAVMGQEHSSDKDCVRSAHRTRSMPVLLALIWGASANRPLPGSCLLMRCGTVPNRRRLRRKSRTLSPNICKAIPEDRMQSEAHNSKAKQI